MELQATETKVYKGFEAINRLETNWIICKTREGVSESRIAYKAEGSVLIGHYLNTGRIAPINTTINFFFENEFVDYEEPYQPGDWVVIDENVCKISDVHVSGRLLVDKISRLTDQLISTKYIKRKATPEEIAQEKRRRVFAKVGRELDEFKKGDVVAMSAGDLSEVTVEEPSAGLIKCVQFDLYNQTFDTFNVNPKSLNLVVPAEHRLDKEGE
ncbi:MULTISPECIES: hypothetical protein [Bacillus cereus group]|uniref:hypothetical protein n=1 Tax=Bacillus cereus group TaxID=86661 RepID=UPI001F58924D|nr:hypothetical protein [Bacillus cereus group sp. BfR-BA-01522]